MSKNIIIGIAGGTGSGKTTITNRIIEAFGSYKVALLEQDCYYRKMSHLPLEERAQQNYDHPNSIEFELLIQHLDDLLNDKAIDKPLYDFKNHTRKEEYEVVEPKKIIIVEGILIFAVPKLLEYFDVKIFVDTDDDERLLRRIERDMLERGRSFESIREQYLNTVKPMHLEFVMPSRRYADVIVPRGGENNVAIKMIIAKLGSMMKK